MTTATAVAPKVVCTPTKDGGCKATRVNAGEKPYTVQVRRDIAQWGYLTVHNAASAKDAQEKARLFLRCDRDGDVVSVEWDNLQEALDESIDSGCDRRIVVGSAEKQ